jgi:nucleoside-diphosphate-sugar epimerase
MKIAVIGVNGFVGKTIGAVIKSDGKNELIGIVRGDDVESKIKSADLIIHAANPAKRFIAESDPKADFNETVIKTNQLLNFSGHKRFVLVSSLSCRTQLDKNYGRNRRSCELLALSKGATVIRLGPMFGGGRTQDTLHDILSGKQIYLSPATRYAYVNVEWAANKIYELIDADTGIYEIGAQNSVSLEQVKKAFDSKSIFQGEDDTQIPIDCKDGPDANLVFEYALAEYEAMREWR